MALTDRQNKFYQEIVVLSQSSKSSDMEKQYFLKAKKSIDSGMSFRAAVNILGLNLDSLERERTLTQTSKVFFDKVKSIYGEPSYWVPHTYRDELPLSDWRNSDPDFVYLRTWNRRDELNNKLSFKKEFISFFNAFLVIAVIFGGTATPVLPWMKKELGEPLFYLVLIVAIFLIFVWLIISENIRMGLKRKK